MTCNFTLMETPPTPEPPDYVKIYGRLLQEHVQAETPSKDWVKRFVYLSVKGVPIIYKKDINPGKGEESPTEEHLQDILSFMLMTSRKVGMLTPNEFLTIFPVEKYYDGEQGGMLDYYSTMEELKKIGMDNPIGDQADMMLFEYQNRHVRRFKVFSLMVISRIRVCQGHPSLAEEFADKMGIKTLRMVTDDKGKQFMYDPANQTTFPIVKKYPRYLRVIK
jgi:hypothetical protein